MIRSSALLILAACSLCTAELVRIDIPNGKPDWLHIGPAGYQTWAERIKPLFDELTR